MLKRLLGIINVSESEVRLFLWVALVLFLLRSGGIFLGNYAETTFLKRFGVEYYPLVTIATAMATFFVMGFLAGLTQRISSDRLLLWCFVWCASTIVLVRYIVTLNFPLIYPSVFILKAQYEIMLAMFFWNMANDIFNVRQSKRLFPLVTAGGVLGQVISNFATPALARAYNMDNLLYVYVLVCLASACAVALMRHYCPSTIFEATERKGLKKEDKPVNKLGIWQMLPMLKSEPLLKFMVLLTFLPNVLIPILNYQFNYVVDEQFATETTMVEFFGYFRGVLNIVSLVVLLFVNRLFNRWGVPVALMFHPLNYAIIFTSFLLRFDIFTAIYARMSANILRSAINVPAVAVLNGMFPKQYRNIVRPFLRGTVVRVGLLLGSSLVLLSEQFIHPRYLSLVALPFFAAWVATPMIFKGRYGDILMDLISRGELNLKGIEPDEAALIFGDEKSSEMLKKSVLTASGQRRAWYARVMASSEEHDVDSVLLEAISLEGDPSARNSLVKLVSHDLRPETIEHLLPLVNPEDKLLSIQILELFYDVESKVATDLSRDLLKKEVDPEIRGLAAAIADKNDPESAHQRIREWLDTGSMEDARSAMVAIGHSKDTAFVPFVEEQLRVAEDLNVINSSLDALDRLDDPNRNELVLPMLSHEDPQVRLHALGAVKVDHCSVLYKVITMFADESVEVHERVKDKVENNFFQDCGMLIQTLGHPSSMVREGVLELLESMKIHGTDIVKFVQNKAEQAFELIAMAQALETMPQNASRDYLQKHLRQLARGRVILILRVLQAQDSTGRIKLIRRGLASSDSRKRANSIEALGATVSWPVARVLTPLLEEGQEKLQVDAGLKLFKIKLPMVSGKGLIKLFLHREDWVTRLLALSVSLTSEKILIDDEMLRSMGGDDNRFVAQMVEMVRRRLDNEGCEGDEPMSGELTLLEKIALLEKVDVFEGLAVGELAAIGSVAEQKNVKAGELVISEGDVSDEMFFVISGAVTVYKRSKRGVEVELDSLGAGDHFREMVLFEETLAPATVRANVDTTLMTLHQVDLNEIVHEYPDVAIHAGRIMSRRLIHMMEIASTKADAVCEYDGPSDEVPKGGAQ